MFISFFYWIILPFLGAWALVTLIKRAPRPIAADLAALVKESPLPPKAFGAARRDAAGLKSLGVFEKLIEASDAAFLARDAALKAGQKASFLVFDSTGDVLEQIDA